MMSKMVRLILKWAVGQFPLRQQRENGMATSDKKHRQDWKFSNGVFNFKSKFCK